MNDDKIYKIFKDHGYIMKTSELRSFKIYHRKIKFLIENNVIEKLKHGYYYLIDENDTSEIKIINRLYEGGIICMNSALFYHGYSDRTPSEWHLAVNKDISKYKIKIDYPFVKIYIYEKNQLEIGLSEIDIDGNSARIYDKERTICDCLRLMWKMDREIFGKAIKNYVMDSNKNIPNLMRYANLLRVEKRVRDLITIWI